MQAWYWAPRQSPVLVFVPDSLLCHLRLKEGWWRQTAAWPKAVPTAQSMRSGLAVEVMGLCSVLGFTMVGMVLCFKSNAWTSFLLPLLPTEQEAPFSIPVQLLWERDNNTATLSFLPSIPLFIFLY